MMVENNRRFSFMTIFNILRSVHGLTRLSAAALMALMLIATAACHNDHPSTPRGDSFKTSSVRILRFEKELFETDEARLQAHLQEITPTYNSPLLNIQPNDEQYMSQLRGFVSDPYIREIYDSVERHYADLGWLERQLGDAMARSQKLLPELRTPQIITFLSGRLDYEYRVVCYDTTVLISLDQYALPCFAKYAYFELPHFIVSLCTHNHLLPDIMAAIARERIAAPTDEPTMLDLMVAEGKVLYFLDCALPDVHDSLKLRYTAAQLDWASANEGKVWAYFIQNNLLYETDANKYFNFVDDAPKTNAFGESAPRMTAYIGRDIVAQYVKRTGITMSDLFANNDAQQILKESAWKPSRK